MPAQYEPRTFTPLGKALYIFTARFFFGPIFFIQNRVEVTGRENIPPGSCLFVANHLSNWDPGLIAFATDRAVSFLAKEELFSDGFFKHLVRTYGAISINRDKPEPSTFKAVKMVLSRGWSLGMFIEGTRSKTPGVLGLPHQGPAYFARSNKLPIIPVGIVGTNIKWGKAYVRIGKPVEPGDTLDDTSWKILEALGALTGFDLPDRLPDSKMAP